ncbi:MULTISPECIES: 4-hydroxy-3-methylbut-2-en-1-yl diphosphate synthase [unclassified Dysgonomonas]|jgi:(E)-4-hydroxy-3-methylbut-2-enyl-diphosphate synthase|uniref:4-hydroxy-3-methylbut-2-en-1-yl diphosphate synthase n=1 Tax=unclassified Dysgonomonas TaxID=2630389 RepID=UPI0025BF9218|nr:MULTISPECIES: 4-hydroxy-3-methylbut-2-en-1-yl diphosphate synthase [unclassified Dysgonomonas]MDR2003579.1 4-hydroxy-3-methylbut-2-en-1-yl diphosphate synthase [Prevotella sp.]HMM03974.1 4-hydroxy-3-methylbut-2-en-1-yl diphosphate synthase [Dysgonomonas sp.]
MNYFNYKRRLSSETRIGDTPLGGSNPVRIQSMTNTNTNDTEASAEQVIRIVKAGADYVRLTAQGVREAENLRNIKEVVRAQGYNTPLIADIHFNPRAAEAAAKIVEKVRINPGNFVDRVKTFETFEYTDEEYAQEIEKIRAKLIPLLDICKEHKTAIRIGVNHGSLSDRIMSRYGDTPEGMVESCMEFLHICIAEGFRDIVISMKTSNTVVMSKAVRLLIARMEKEDLNFPLHLGVTEAGDGEDGRIKSAVGIGSLLSDGIGDTIRVSLSEDPEYEVPVARKLVAYIGRKEDHPEIVAEACDRFSPFSTDRRETYTVGNIGGDSLPVVISDRSQGNFEFNVHFLPDYLYVGKELPLSAPRAIPSIIDLDGWKGEKNTYPLFDKPNWEKIRGNDAAIKFLRLSYPELDNNIISLLKADKSIVIILTTNHINGVGEQRAFIHTLMNNDCDTPVIPNRRYEENETEDLQIKAATDFGTLYLDGFGNGIMLENKGNISLKNIDAYMFGILQASRIRTSKTEYISCPSCGRTLFDLQTTVALVKGATSHLKHLKIGVMGCIVNGPGEMADADYGYVGAEKGKISLYKKKHLIEKNIASEEAVERLVQLIKDNGDWMEPEN